MNYFNTSHLEGSELTTAQNKAFTQNEAILMLFKREGLAISPSQVLFKLEQSTRINWLITSVRRGITTLERKGKLVKTDLQVKSQYGGKEYLWKLA